MASATSAGVRPRVVIFDPIPGEWSWALETRILGRRGVDLVVPADAAEADEAIRTADAVIVTGVGRLDATRVASLERCVGILCYSIGMDKVDGPTAAARDIPVRNVPDYCTDEVSDHGLALLLAAQRRLLPLATATAAGTWPAGDRSITGSIRRLRGQTLGVVGAGRIGRLVARKARAFGFRTIAFDPFIAASDDGDLHLVDRDELLRTADAIVLCAAYTPGSPPFISSDALELVKPGVIIVNISRGGHVDELALADALLDGRVAVAALDVRATEPPARADDPLAGLPNVIVTPHVAATSRDAIDDLHRLAAEYVLGLLETGGRIPRGGRLMARYPQGILVACPTPWDEQFELMEDVLREEVRLVLAAGFTHCYVFGTGGEGYAVDTRRFRAVVDVFHEETSGADVNAMVGVIGLSTAQIVERIEYAHDVGFRIFQISLPSWGPLADDELLRFFKDTCGRFPDSRFLHYNLPRTKRVLAGADYARIIPEVPNLVATKTTGGGLAAAEELIRNAGELQHFMGEGNFPHGAMFGECSLLASYAELSPRMTFALFEAGRDRDTGTLMQLQHDFQTMSAKLWAQPAPGPHMDGAFDKMLVKLGMLPDFPLRLLSPYRGFTDDDYRACRRLLDEQYADWLEPTAGTLSA